MSTWTVSVLRPSTALSSFNGCSTTASRRETERSESASPSFSELLRGTVALAGPSIGPTIALDLDEAGLADAELIGNTTALQQVIVNLLLHVQGSMRPGGTIAITGEVVRLTPDDAREHDDFAPGPYVVFTVGTPDGATSTALTEADVDDVAVANNPGQGSGLGLSIALGTVRAHGGWIDVAPRGGESDLLRVWLPIAASEALEGPL